MKTGRCRPLLLLCLVILGFCLAGCGLSLYERYELRVPFRYQERNDYCAPASVLMWRLYDGLSPVSQTTIYNWVGRRACLATEVPSAVNHFTNTSDAYLDIVFNPSDRNVEDLIARQITAEEQPVYDALKENRLRVQIVRVENWDLSRCGSIRPVPYYNLLRFYDPVSGEEVARSTQHFTGLMGVYHNLSERVPELPSLPNVDALLRLRFQRTLSIQEA